LDELLDEDVPLFDDDDDDDAPQGEQHWGGQEDVAVPMLSEERVFADDTRPQLKVDLLAQWPAFLQQLLDERPHLGSFLSHGYVAAFHDTKLDLRFSPLHKFHFGEVTRKQNRDIIQQKLNHFAGCAIELHITMDSGEGQGESKNYLDEIGGNEPCIEDDIKNEPIINTVLKLFDGEIL
jgi:hypothetical protein